MAIQKKPPTRATTADIMSKAPPSQPPRVLERAAASVKETQKVALTQISAKIPTELHRQVRIKCLQEGVEMQRVIADLLAVWVRK